VRGLLLRGLPLLRDDRDDSDDRDPGAQSVQ
jgi:hypothetical protein